MQRGSWTFLAMFVFVLVLVLLFGWFYSGDRKDQTWVDTQQVRTYAVPSERGEAIRDALRVVLLSTREGAQPLGQASLPVPNMLVVSAPTAMHASIKTAIAELSQGASAESKVARSVAFDLWVLAATDAGETLDDPALAAMRPLLDRARQEYGLESLRLVERALVVASKGRGSSASPVVRIQTGGMTGSLSLHVIGDDGVHASLDIRLSEVANGRQRGVHFSSTFSLPNDQWQVIGLLGGSDDTPDRLLLMRQRTALPES